MVFFIVLLLRVPLATFGNYSQLCMEVFEGRNICDIFTLKLSFSILQCKM